MSKPAPPKHTVPIQNGKCTGTITPVWFVNGSEYNPLEARYRPLVNGREAFREVYRAIDAAKKTVCIICWGFQPSMYFIRDGTHMTIGQLLEKKAREGVMVRVLCWAFEMIQIPRSGEHRFNVTGLKAGLGESNTPGRWVVGISDKPITETDEQYEYDCRWYRIYDRKTDYLSELGRRYLISNDFPKDKLLFYSRSYSASDRATLGKLDYIDQDLELTTKLTMKWTPSHHQKMVLVDHEDPQAAVGFVMGHNMLDFYWDTPDHSGTPKPPNVGRNGGSPLHDYSSRVTGPIVGDLFQNFADAWQKETGESLPRPDFPTYPLLGIDDKAVCQILRTQPQTKIPTQDIAKCYLQAVSNATKSIVIENQYFRWPPLAEAIAESAAVMADWGRCPEKHGFLYLFVITNSSDDGMGKGTVNTYRMLDALGRADRLPEVTRQQTDEELKTIDRATKSLQRQRAAIAKEEAYVKGIPSTNGKSDPIKEQLSMYETRKAQIDRDLAKHEARKAVLDARKREFEERKAGKTTDSKRKGEVIAPRELPGLKVHIATLVAPDTAPGEAWQEVYIHAKLMMIDDTFMTAGSANINSRSMQTDSELNIAHHRPEITGPLRERQWDKYTRGVGADSARIPPGTSLEKAFYQWGKLMNDNAAAKESKQSPLAQLHEFLRTSDKISNND
jgi:phosphatidylserine/phosphatidylglycerophosphate/cardiolipin synthase-like enzyme